MSEQKVWANILAGVKSQVSSSTYKTWFLGSFLLDFKKGDDKNLLIVGVKNSFVKEQIETRYIELISNVSKKAGFSGEVLFVVSKVEKNKAAGDGAPLFSGVAQTYIGFSRKNEALNPSHTFENFVIGQANNLAYLAFKNASESPGRVYNPLFVWGHTGVGKTHLLQAIGNEILGKVLDAKVLYASAEKFTNDYIESLNSRTTPAFRQKYRGVDVLLLDDVQFFSGKESTQDEFFFTFNELHMAGKQIVLASDKHPRDIGRIQDRLLSRFMGGMTVDIQIPDVELRSAILKFKCHEKGVEVGGEVIDYIASRCQGGVRELEGLLIQVLTLTKLSSGKITLDEIKRAVGGNIKEAKSRPTPGKIIDAVCRHFRIGSNLIYGQTRKASVVYPRQILMYLLRSDLGLALEGIGELVGGRDHSTVLYGIEKIAKLVATDQNKRDEISRIRATF